MDREEALGEDSAEEQEELPEATLEEDPEVALGEDFEVLLEAEVSEIDVTQLEYQ